MSRVRTEEEKLLLNPYVSLSTIQRYFSLSKTDAVDIFVKVQETDEEKGFLKLYEDKVRSEGVFELLGINYQHALMRYQTKKVSSAKETTKRARTL